MSAETLSTTFLLILPVVAFFTGYILHILLLKRDNRKLKIWSFICYSITAFGLLAFLVLLYVKAVYD